MARKALIQTSTGLVRNVLVLPDNVPFEIDPGSSLIDGEGASPGDTWDGSRFITPAPEPPNRALVRRSELEALLLAGPVNLPILQEYILNRLIVAP